MKTRHAFTLIELLIVVAIIAILAAIAVPNFLEAQVRSKVSRAVSDMRSTVTALESYAVDYNNAYPPAADYGRDPSPVGPCFHSRVPTYLTTPIAYLSSLTIDPFVTQDSTFSNICYPEGTNVGKRYSYYSLSRWNVPSRTPAVQPYQIHAAGSDAWGGLEAWVGKWLLYSYGPDKRWSHGARATLLPYDPTNGTTSLGNIIRCQKKQDGVPPHPTTGTYFWP
jgi:prepilin-type N-terminal cleavage/methylation domain-containing protein